MEPQEMTDLLHDAMKHRMAGLLRSEIADTEKWLDRVDTLSPADKALWLTMSVEGKMRVLTGALRDYLVILEEKVRTLPAPTVPKDI